MREVPVHPQGMGPDFPAPLKNEDNPYYKGGGMGISYANESMDYMKEELLHAWQSGQEEVIFNVSEIISEGR